MPRPTLEQLEKINRFTIVPLTEENCYVFNDMMIDDKPTAYSSIIHDNLLRKFLKDASKGVALLLNHDTRKLPVGRSFGAELKEEYDEETGEVVKSLYGHFYIDLGRQTESNMTTDDIAKALDAGTVFDTSIGFNAESWKCSICGNDIRDWWSCPHIPGEKYAVERNRQDVVEICYVIVGDDGVGELLENSLVYAGACDRASVRRNFSMTSDVKENQKGTKLHVIDNIKNVPLNATIYQYYTRDGSVLFTDTSERTNGLEELRKRSEQTVELEKFKAILKEFGINAETPEELSTALASLFEAKELHTQAVVELEQIKTELTQTTAELEEVRGQLSAKDAVIEELTQKNEELSEKAELAQTYRQELIQKALEMGVRAQGNAFNTKLYEKFLSTLSIDEIKEAIESFENEVKSRFDGVRISQGSDNSAKARFNKEPKSKEDFESDEEFRTFVAEKAVEYAREHNVSISEATKLMYKKYTKDGSEE